MATRTPTGDSLADQAYRRIREKILRGEYPLGPRFAPPVGG